ncbi:MAG: DUF805 domain-containing protein [Magnetovibrio sp.]|nr:DUF805 domain-containing protein [Magnetovibrio sp.]
MSKSSTGFVKQLSGLAVLVMSLILSSDVVWAQQGTISPHELQQLEQLETMAAMIGVGTNVLFLAVFGTIILIARRNMSGWRQPIKWVWFSFSGRLNRKAYWLKGFLPLSMINTAIQLFAMLIGLGLGESEGTAAVVGGIALMVVVLPFMVFSFWAGLAITVKRFHDLGSSGWWIFGFFIPFYNFWLAIKLAFFRGTIGANRFGDDPIDPVKEYITEMAGGSGDDEDEAEAPTHPKPRPPEGGDAAPRGFGSKPFAQPGQPAAVQPEPEEEFTPAQMSGGDTNTEVIKRRLGNDIMSPIKRRGGGGRDAQG